MENFGQGKGVGELSSYGWGFAREESSGLLTVQFVVLSTVVYIGCQAVEEIQSVDTKVEI